MIEEKTLKNVFDREDVFHDLAWHWFEEHKLKILKEDVEFWKIQKSEGVDNETVVN